MTEDGTEDELDAAVAFEALRTEVAQLREDLRAGLERTVGAGTDYALTLGTMAKRLAAIEAHPALRLTPMRFGQQLREALEITHRSGEMRLEKVLQRIEGAAFQVEKIAGRAREPGGQRRWLMGALGLGVMFGILGWVGLSGPVARGLPRSWAVPERMAAATMGLDRWEAGGRLMESGSPAGWERLRRADELFRTRSARNGRDRHKPGPDN